MNESRATRVEENMVTLLRIGYGLDVSKSLQAPAPLANTSHVRLALFGTLRLYLALQLAL